MLAKSQAGVHRPATLPARLFFFLFTPSFFVCFVLPSEWPEALAVIGHSALIVEGTTTGHRIWT